MFLHSNGTLTIYSVLLCEINTFYSIASSKPFCATVQFSSPNIRDYWCVATAPTAIFSATTEFTGATRSYSTVAKSELWSITEDTVSSSHTFTATTKSEEEDSQPTSDETQNMPTPKPSASDVSAGSSNAGNIGDAVRGVLGVALLGIGAFFL